ncbi:4Fe-4S dicluster domain-containing protein [Candidatus Poribacteria bacterium]|nr:4Fe-4S dicluster domain-containing protein [Candidatus Poribacteria bacterium]
MLTTAELAPDPPSGRPEDCGDCRRCLDACPTGAITAPWEFDERRCISYLTIEHEGPMEPELASKLDGWVFGCDVCQDVCPYNRTRARPAADSPFLPALVPGEWELADLLAMDSGRLESEFAQSPVRRAGAESLIRNALLVAAEGVPDCGIHASACRVAENREQPGWLRCLAERVAERTK